MQSIPIGEESGRCINRWAHLKWTEFTHLSCTDLVWVCVQFTCYQLSYIKRNTHNNHYPSYLLQVNDHKWKSRNYYQLINNIYIQEVLYLCHLTDWLFYSSLFLLHLLLPNNSHSSNRDSLYFVQFENKNRQIVQHNKWLMQKCRSWHGIAQANNRCNSDGMVRLTFQNQ